MSYLHVSHSSHLLESKNVSRYKHSLPSIQSQSLPPSNTDEHTLRHTHHQTDHRTAEKYDWRAVLALLTAVSHTILQRARILCHNQSPITHLEQQLRVNSARVSRDYRLGGLEAWKTRSFSSPYTLLARPHLHGPPHMPIESHTIAYDSTRPSKYTMHANKNCNDDDMKGC